MGRGHFIVVEGLEGAGKSTAIHTVKQCLQSHGLEILATREPGGTRVGDATRHLIKETTQEEVLDPRAELLLLYASRVQLIESVIRPALHRGVWVIADRFELSTWAYQGGGRKLDPGMIRALSSFCLNEIKPDLILFLDLPPEQGLKRARKRGKPDRIEQESLAFFKDVYAGYHKQLKTMSNVIVIDACKPLAHVQHLIRASLESYWLTHHEA